MYMYTAIQRTAKLLLVINIVNIDYLLDEALVDEGTESTDEETLLDQNASNGGRSAGCGVLRVQQRVSNSGDGPCSSSNQRVEGADSKGKEVNTWDENNEVLSGIGVDSVDDLKLRVSGDGRCLNLVLLSGSAHIHSEEAVNY